MNWNSVTASIFCPKRPGRTTPFSSVTMLATPVIPYFLLTPTFAKMAESGMLSIRPRPNSCGERTSLFTVASAGTTSCGRFCAVPPPEAAKPEVVLV